MRATIDRRDFLGLAAGLGLSLALPGMGPRAASRRGPERPKSLVIVWLEGGPSQLETWDPHPAGSIGGPTRAIATSVPGLQVAEHFPRLAGEMHHLSLVRSLVSKEGDHARASHYVRTGYRPDATLAHPSLGSIVASELPGQALEIPPFISMGYSERRSRGGYLGGRYDAFYLSDPEANRATARSRDEREERRLKSLDVVGEAFSKGREPAIARTLYRESLDAAVRMMTSEQIRAFDASAEPRAVRAAYGDSPVGRACLIARRLLEQGVRVVEVTQLNYDAHEDNFNRHRSLAADLDPALSALIRDLGDRHLLESTVLLCLGEFGRTPRINPKEGRDHWPTGFSCLVGGAGLARGTVIGATDPTGHRKAPDDPIQLPDLYATVLHALGIDFSHTVMTPIGRPIRFSDGKPIARLLV
jgi:uncharacterized protein (DUF1501 family)